MKNPFKNYSTKNIKDNFKRASNDPYASLKMTYRFTAGITYLLMAVIAYVFINLIIKVRASSAGMSLLLVAVYLIVGIMLLWKIYSLVLIPKKKMLAHYEATPETQTSRFVDTNKEVDEIFEHFDKKKELENKKIGVRK